MLISFNSGYLGLLCKAQLGRQEYDNALTLPKKRMDNHTIKANIRAIRESKGLTQEQMALRLGMNRQSYWTLENGKTQLVSERLFDIANALNTPLEKFIIDGPGEPCVELTFFFGQLTFLDQKCCFLR